jgi:hypothetical protein
MSSACVLMGRFLFYISAAFAFLSAASWAQEKAAVPPLPPIRSLALEPGTLTLEDGRDARKVLVTGQDASGRRFDLTAAATFGLPDVVEQDADGYLRPRAVGQGEVVVKAAGLEAKLPVVVRSADQPPVRFVREVMPLFGKIGCNAGTCHGAEQGKNGFKLSLRGYDPDWDYAQLVFDGAGRRFNRVVPEESLMLLKPTAAVPHEGKQALKPGSRAHALILRWLHEGARPEELSARAARIEILPSSDIELDLPGRSHQVAVVAVFADGATRDVTREAVLSSSDTEIAVVDGNVVTALRRGEASVLVRYEGSYATKLLTVMGEREGYAWVDEPEENFIDRHIHAKLRRIKALPSGLCSDAEFIRRISLDLTGLPPTPERARAFVEDPAPSPEKRRRLAAELIGGPAFVEHWANKWADLLQCNSETLGQKGVQVFRDWIRASIAQNKPYDRFVRELLTAQGSAYYQPAVNYFRSLREPGKITEDVSQTFLGVRFNCTKCHDHPFERWTQNQYYQFGAYFARVAIKRGTLGTETERTFTGDNVQVVGEEIVYLNHAGGEVRHPKTAMAVGPKVPFGEAAAPDGGADRREPFVDWLTSPENPLFARAMANRLWSYFFGRGIIDPVDDIRAGNPPVNAELLDALTEEFVKSGFDLRAMMRVIIASRAYQRSVATNRWNEDDRINFSHAIPRRLTAEQLMDAVATAVDVPVRFQGLPPGMRAAEIADGMVAGGMMGQGASVATFLKLFGRPERKSACECERKTDSFSLSHTLSLINGPVIGEALAAPGNRISRLAESVADDRKLVEEIYYAVLSRPPTPSEADAIDLKAGGTRAEIAQDLTWALMNTPAFFFNR